MRTTHSTGLLTPTTTTRTTATLSFPSSRFPAKEHVSIEEVFDAYYSCRKRKRRKRSALQFELNYELCCYELWKELNSLQYNPTTSIAFCVTKPKLREVFAANFRDRIIHHLIHNKLNQYFEMEMIDNAFACRQGKGSLYGVKQIQNFMRTLGKEAWYVKCDISGFFMAIDRDILYKEIRRILLKYNIQDLEWWAWLVNKVIYNRPELDCEKRGNVHLFSKLPKNKTLFYSNGVGLPIGNLTSQILANVYMSILDRWMLQKLGTNSGYGRYVDDFIIIHRSKTKLLQILSKVRNFLQKTLHLKLHPCKIVIQPIYNGVKFTGMYVRQTCILPGKPTMYNAMRVIRRWNINSKDIIKFISSVNSYLGLVLHTCSFRFRRRMLRLIINNSNLCFIKTRKIKIVQK